MSSIITVKQYFNLPKGDRIGAKMIMSNDDEWKIEEIKISNTQAEKELYLIKVKGIMMCRSADEEIILMPEKKKTKN